MNPRTTLAQSTAPEPRVEVAMDWTDFDADNQATIMLSLITRHGRTTGCDPK
jgi:hypothetical protein